MRIPHINNFRFFLCDKEFKGTKVQRLKSEFRTRDCSDTFLSLTYGQVIELINK